MTITLSWWIIPLMFVVMGLYFIAKPQRDYDFITPIFSIGSLLAAVLFTAAYWIGRISA